MPPPDPAKAAELAGRLESLGRDLGTREAEHRPALERARRCAEALRAEVAGGLAAFQAAVDGAGAPHLRVQLGELRTDQKHLRAVEFDLVRGRHRAIVTVKSRGDVTLVGPFHVGKTEGPCLTFPIDSQSEIAKALGDFLERFLVEAATP